MIEEIQKWLASDQDYRTGVALYFKYGRYPQLKVIFQKMENSYSREKLLNEFRSIVRAAGARPENVEPIKVAPSFVEKMEYNRPSTRTEQKPSINDDLWELYKDLEIQRNKLSNYYHVLFKSNASQKELAEHYQRIEEKSKEMVEIWEKIHNTGATEKAKEDKESLMKWKQRLIDQKYKLNKKLKNLIDYPDGSSKRKVMEQELAIVQMKTEEVIEKIKKLRI